MAQTPETFRAGVAGASEQRISFFTWRGLNHPVFKKWLGLYLHKTPFDSGI
jgi:hypothetical protein